MCSPERDEQPASRLSSSSHWLTGTLTIKLLFKGAVRALACEILTLLGIIWVLNNLLIRDSNFCEQPANPRDYRLTAQHWIQSVHHKWSPVAVNSNYMPCCWYDLLWRGTSMELWGVFGCSYATQLPSHIFSYQLSGSESDREHGGKKFSFCHFIPQITLTGSTFRSFKYWES